MLQIMKHLTIYCCRANVVVVVLPWLCPVSHQGLYWVMELLVNSLLTVISAVTPGMQRGADIWGCCDGWRLCLLATMHLASCWARPSLNLPLMMRMEQGLLGVCVCAYGYPLISVKFWDNYAQKWQDHYSKLDHMTFTLHSIRLSSLHRKDLICRLKISMKILVTLNYRTLNRRTEDGWRDKEGFRF